MRFLIGLAIGFLLVVSVMTAYPSSKLGHDYFITWWVVARAVAVPYLFISLRAIVGGRACLLMKILLGSCYYGSLLAIGWWFLSPIYPTLDVFALMIFGVVPLLFWGNPQTPSKPSDIGNTTATRDV